MLQAMNSHSKIAQTLRGSELPIDPERIYARNLEVPSGGAVGTAASDRACLRRVCHGRAGTGSAARDTRPVGRACDASDARISRRLSRRGRCSSRLAS
jgi:hypothetical protein